MIITIIISPWHPVASPRDPLEACRVVSGMAGGAGGGAGGGAAGSTVGECSFPPRWEGTWFQSGVRQSIVISRNELSSKGRCLHNEGDKFLLVDIRERFVQSIISNNTIERLQQQQQQHQ
ncbi:hypothetical protein M0804_003505 [Polistes exclamans]|nr:hypothetical protein M0804_003505 [Polistes exclamans]